MRLYEPILKDEAAAEETETEDGEEVETAAPKDFIDLLNPDSLTTLTGCLVEPAIAESNVGDPVSSSCAWVTSARIRTPPLRNRSSTASFP